MINNIRTSAKAIIINEDKVLLTKNQDNEGFFYLFPGGGQEHGETLHNALVRECIEEVGLEVSIGKLLHIREYIGKNHEHSSFDFDFHQVEFYFACKLKNEVDTYIEPTNPDSYQVGMEWITIKDLPNYRIYPQGLKEHIAKPYDDENIVVYLGDIN